VHFDIFLLDSATVVLPRPLPGVLIISHQNQFVGNCFVFVYFGLLFLPSF